ncbi:unnamed protein product [Discula destructiva]
MWIPALPGVRGDDHAQQVAAAVAAANLLKRASHIPDCPSDNIWQCQPGISFALVCAIIIGCALLYWLMLQIWPRKEPINWRKSLPFLFPANKKKRRARNPPVYTKSLETELPAMESSPLGASLRASVLWPKTGEYPALPERIRPARDRAPEIKVYSPI